MNDRAGQLSLVSLSGLMIKKSTRHRFFTEFAIADRKGKGVGHTQISGNKALLLLFSFSDGWLFPSRPMEVRDQDGHPVLWIEFSGILRRVVITVRRPDRSLLGRLVGQTWATTLRGKGFWIEAGGERVGKILAGKDEYRIVDSAGVEIARADKKRGQPSYSIDHAVTALRIQQHLSEPLAGLAIATTVLRHLA